MPINPRTGRWLVVNESPDGYQVIMAFWDTRKEAEKDCIEYAKQSPAHLELEWFIRQELNPTQAFYPAK